MPKIRYDRQLTVKRLQGWRGRSPSSYAFDRPPKCIAGCTDGEYDHIAHGSQNLAINSAPSRVDSVSWFDTAVREELDRGVFTSEVGSNDYNVRVAMESWLPARAITHNANHDTTLLTRRVWFQWALFALASTTFPRKSIKLIHPTRVRGYGPSIYQGPGLRCNLPGMRHKITKHHMTHEDQGHLISFILDHRPRGSRFSGDYIYRPWPVLSECCRTYPYQPGRYLKARPMYSSHIQAVVLGFCDIDDLEFPYKGNYRRNLLNRVVGGDIPAVSELSYILNREQFILYPIYRRGVKQVTGAHLFIIHYTDGSKEIIWAHPDNPNRAPVINGNGDIQVGYVYHDVTDGSYIAATPFHNKHPRGGWEIHVDNAKVTLAAKLAEYGGDITINRPSKRVAWRVLLSPTGVEVVK